MSYQWTGVYTTARIIKAIGKQNYLGSKNYEKKQASCFYRYFLVLY